GRGASRQSAGGKQADLAARPAEAATLAERLASAETIATRIAHELQELATRTPALVLNKKAIEREQGQLAAQTVEHQRQVESLRAEKQRLEARGDQMEQELSDTRTRSAQA